MSNNNQVVGYMRNIDTVEICEHQSSLKTHDGVPIKKLLIANLNPQSTHKSLLNAFKVYGRVVHCILKKQKQYNKMRINIEYANKKNQNETKSYAFITYNTTTEAQKAIQAGIERNIRLDMHFLRVIPANSWNQPDHRNSHYRMKTCKLCRYKSLSVERYMKLPNNYVYFRVEDGAHISKLDNDCLRHIFNYLPFIDRVRIERVSRRWKQVSQDTWRDLHKIDCNPMKWGIRSPTLKLSTNPDACSFYKILMKCHPFITHLDLSQFSNKLGNGILQEIAKMCISIQSINLINMQFSNSGIRALANHCHSLKSIAVGYTDSRYKFDKELSLLFLRNRNLQHVDIDCFIIEGSCFNYVHKKSIQDLIWRNCNHVIRKGTYKLFDRFENLRIIKIIPTINLHYRKLIGSISLCSKLEVVEIPKRRRCDMIFDSTGILYPLMNLKNLSQLNLRRNAAVDDYLLIVLSRECVMLKYIDISGCIQLTNSGIESVTSLKNLEYLCIDGLKNITDGVFLKEMPKIKTLLCSGCVKLQSLGISMLFESSGQLELLDLTNCKLIDNTLVMNAIKHCKLRKQRCLRLYLHGTKVNLDGIDVNSYWTYLRIFDVERPQGELSYCYG